MKLLSGRILKPSHSSSFVDTLLSCQPDSPVSRLVLPEDETQQKIQDIYTHISPKESPYASQITLFSKTSKESSAVKQPMENRYSNMSSETWKKEVTVQRGEYSARLKQVRHINEKESLSWLTPTMTERSGTNPKTGNKEGLSKQVKKWPTPNRRDHKGTYRTLLRKDGRMRGDLLPDAVRINQDGLPDQEKSSTSGKSQESPGKLNPNWVEQLMGLPLGWTQLPIEWID